MATILPEAKQRYTDSAGAPLAGGKVYTYAAGTSTPKATYSDSSGSTANTNPVILDARGEATIFWKGKYKVALKDSDGALIYTVDNVGASSDFVLLTEFGAVGDGGTTNNLGPISDAIAASAGRTIRVPVDLAGGDYAVTSGTLAIPSTARFEYEAGARIYQSGGSISDSGRHVWLFGGGSGEQSPEDVVRGLNVALLGGNAGAATASTAAFNKLRIKGDSVAGNTKVDGLLVFHDFGGAGSSGGRHAIEGVLSQTAVTDPVGNDRNYVGVQGACSTAVGDNGSPEARKGGYFGGSFIATLFSGAEDTLNVTGAEFNVQVKAGASTGYRSGIQIGAYGTERGEDYDAAVSISNVGAGASNTCTWKNAILIGSQNGRRALAEDSNVINIVSPETINAVIYAPTVATSFGAIIMADVELKGNALRLKDANAVASIGSITTAGTSVVDFHSSGLNTTYDARISCEGGTADTGAAGLYFGAADFSRFSGPVRPSVTDTISLGTGSYKWAQLYATTATINISDERDKQQIRTLNTPEQAVAEALKGLIRAFKFNAAVEAKGAGARIHFGVIAQDVVAAFAAQGLDATDYGMICYDEWDEIPEVVDETGNVTQGYRAAGNRYGVRYEELLAFIIAAM